MEGGNLKYIPKIFSIHQRQSLDSTSLSRLSFANPKEENAESRTAAEERSSSSKTVLPLSLSRPRTPPPQGFLPPRVESRLDFLGKVERVPLWAVHLVALPLHQTNRQPLLGETGIKDNASLNVSLSLSLSSPLTSPSPVRNYALGLDPDPNEDIPTPHPRSFLPPPPSRGNNWP